MKTDEIASAYGLPDKEHFKKYVIDIGEGVEAGFFGSAVDIPVNKVKEIVDGYKKYLAHQQMLTKQKQQEEFERQQEISKILITSGFNFDGYKVTRYSGYISGDDVIQVDRSESSGWFGLNTRAVDVGEELSKALVKLRRHALQELKEAAYDLGCNAVIGVDFDYLTLDPETATSKGGTLYLPYVFCVTANGNAVVIEKIEE